MCVEFFLELLVSRFLEICLKLKVENICIKYSGVFNRFCKWCLCYNIFLLLVLDYNVFLYLIYFSDICNLVVIIDEVFYVISWIYKLCGFFDFCILFFFILIREGCYRFIGY